MDKSVEDQQCVYMWMNFIIILCMLHVLHWAGWGSSPMAVCCCLLYWWRVPGWCCTSHWNGAPSPSHSQSALVTQCSLILCVYVYFDCNAHLPSHHQPAQGTCCLFILHASTVSIQALLSHTVLFCIVMHIVMLQCLTPSSCSTHCTTCSSLIPWLSAVHAVLLALL